MVNNVIVAPSDVWKYFHAHRSELSTDMHLLAEGSDGTIGIYITENDGDPDFIVEDCDEVVAEDMVFTKDECEETAKELYAYHLGYTEFDNTADTELERDYIEVCEEEIKEREDEITVLFQTLLIDLLVDVYDEDTIDEIAEDVKEHTLEYIARKHGLPIYRPMYLEDEDGNDFYSEYPYEEMIFDDCNPIYESD